MRSAEGDVQQQWHQFRKGGESVNELKDLVNKLDQDKVKRDCGQGNIKWKFLLHLIVFFGGGGGGRG